MHPSADDALRAVVREIGALISEGKVRAWGPSNESAPGLIRLCQLCKEENVAPPATIQNSYSLIHRSFEENGLAEACSPLNHGVGLLPWSVMAGGALSGKYLSDERAAKVAERAPSAAQWRMRSFPERYPRWMSDRATAAVDAYCRIADNMTGGSLSPAQLAYAFARSRPFVPSTIVGATSVAQLREGLAAFAGPPGGSADRFWGADGSGGSGGGSGSGAPCLWTPEIEAAIDAVHLQNRNPTLQD